ncbi:MAG: antibiotic biosynthesis monooxygenase [Gammaproteobacteria bacterium]|nr:antibiotic biosynthesis monooxygenase [Gammaproteobacteria bacterium]
MENPLLQPTPVGSYAVIFVSERTPDDQEGYESMAAEMVRLAQAQSGFIDMQSVRGSDGVGITVCYWESAEAIAAWKSNVDHAAAQEQGRASWYSSYAVTIARVLRSHGQVSRR